MKTTNLCLAVIVLFCFACRKKETTTNDSPMPGHYPGPCQPSVRYLTDTRLLACKYKIGSFWIFTDSLSGKTDTLIVAKMNRRPVLLYGQGCDTAETFIVNVTFKNETTDPFRSMNFNLGPYMVYFSNNYIWNRGPLGIYVGDANGCTMHDSLLIGNTFYKDVGESIAFEFVTNDPNRMEWQSMKIYFSPEYGPLQFDFRDRLAGVLTGRRKIIERNIVR